VTPTLTLARAQRPAESSIQSPERWPPRIGSLAALDTIETAHPRYLGAQDQEHRIRSIYQQTFIDPYTKVAFAKVYDRKSALVAADMLKSSRLAQFAQTGLCHALHRAIPWVPLMTMVALRSVLGQ
jgi:hypothetical protein